MEPTPTKPKTMYGLSREYMEQHTEEMAPIADMTLEDMRAFIRTLEYPSILDKMRGFVIACDLWHVSNKYRVPQPRLFALLGFEKRDRVCDRCGEEKAPQESPAPMDKLCRRCFQFMTMNSFYGKMGERKDDRQDEARR